LGFVGFGAMARKMAPRLRDAGYVVVVFDPAHHGDDIDGYRLMKNAAAVAQEVETVIVSVPADAALEQSVQGRGGVFEGARKGLLLIDTSTVSPGASKKIAEAASRQGVRFVEAPVSGSTPEAETGKLIVLAAGEEADVAFAAPVLDIIGRKTIYAGSAGQGLVLKLVINGVMALATAALAEGICYGVAAGLDREMLIKTLMRLTIVAEHDHPKLEMALQGVYPARFATRLLSKDLGLLLADAAKHGVPMGGMAAASQLFSLATIKHADEDYAAAIAVMEELVRK
jgi:3-hydroxyisobutyrate dehydrogenase-like beta-hydroxyacid dehydrogenase